MWHDAELVAPETFDKGRRCSHVTVTYEGATAHTPGTVATTEQCSTVLSMYNCGPQCHSHDRSHPVTVDELLGFIEGRKAQTDDEGPFSRRGHSRNIPFQDSLVMLARV